MKNALRLSSGRALVLVVGVLALSGAVQSAEAVVPDQWIAKMYTEALGRIPDQGGWQSSIDYFDAAGCSAASLKSHGRGIYLSAEYSNLGYDNAAKLLTLYRGVLNREPDLGGFNSWLGQLDSGTPWATVVDAFLDSSELSSMVSSICSWSTTSYNFGTAGVIDLPTIGGGFQGGTGSQLQALLNSAPSGSTVWLAQRAVVRLSTTLTIPANVTLATTGSPTRTRYASMARLIRVASFSAPAVQLRGGAKLKSVWVDGRRSNPTYFNQPSINVQLLGGTGTTVSRCRLSNTMGWSTLQALGTFEGRPCSSNVVTENLITAYTSGHRDGTWADGLSIACEDTLVHSNHIIDATDVPIVLFRAHPAVQRSEVRDNYILNAGNSAYGGLVVDPLHSQGFEPSFSGASVHDNTLWTGTRTHYDICVSVGTRAWFGTSSDTGRGVSVYNNTTGSVRSNVDLGIGVSGMLDAYVQANDLLVTHVNVSACPTIDVGASVSAGFASGSIQAYTDILIQGCIGH